MSDGISFFSNDELEKDVDKVLSQTNYTREQAIEKLKLFNSDYMMVIKDYMGIPVQKIKAVPKKSLNQEIFRQIRTTLDKSSREYREQHPIDMNQVIENFQESEEREKNKTGR